MSKQKSYSNALFWDNNSDESPKKSNNIKNVLPKSPSPNTVKTVYANGPVYRSNVSSSTRVQAIDYNSALKQEPKVLTVMAPLKTKNDLMKEKDNMIQGLLNEVCFKENDLRMMVANFYKEKKIDRRTGSLLAHLQPILISYYNNSNEDRYPALSSRKFQEQVTKYYEKFDIDVTFRNDADNELWRIYLYPQ